MNRKKKFEWYGVIRVTAAILIALLIAAAIIFAVADDPGTALTDSCWDHFRQKETSLM